MVPNKGIDKLISEFSQLKDSIGGLKDMLVKLEYETRPKKIASSIEAKLMGL